MGYNPGGHKESDTTERLKFTFFHTETEARWGAQAPNTQAEALSSTPGQCPLRGLGRASPGRLRVGS